MQMISIINYGMGNLGSIQNILKKIGVNSIITSNPIEILKSEKLILPGIGAYDKGMNNIHQLGLYDAINHAVCIDKIPILGICLGMQLMTNQSEEGTSIKGFSWIDAETKRFRFDDPAIKVPHMGWNFTNISKPSKLFSHSEQINKFYFVHSYYVSLNNNDDELTNTNYGFNFTSSFEKDNIFGVQFHPEKSHKYGMNLLANFAKL